MIIIYIIYSPVIARPFPHYNPANPADAFADSKSVAAAGLETKTGHKVGAGGQQCGLRR